MVKFDHLSEGTSNTTWLAAAQWADVAEWTLGAANTLVVVAAHPDDETLGAAGLMATAHAAGVRVSVIVATAGEGSHPASPSHAPSQLAAIRRLEVVRAIEEVAPGARITMLGLPDGDLRNHRAEVQRAIEADIGASAAAVVVAPWRADAHPDHTAVGEAAASVVLHRHGALLLEYPIWGWHWATPDETAWPWHRMRTVRLDDDATAAKLRALACHRSQTVGLSYAAGDEAIVSGAFAENFERGFECFFLAQDTGGARDRPDSSRAGCSSLARSYFDDFYEGATDPWGFETRWYEERKRALTLASLPRRQFGRALEIGSSIGVLTSELATRCDSLLGTDIAVAPLEIARGRLATQTHVWFEQRNLPDEWPEGVFDLIVVSEVGYYLSEAQLDALIERATAALAVDGIVIACHWRHPVAEYPLSGDQVHAAFHRASGLRRTASYDDDDMLLDVFGRTGAPSVAQVEGLA